MSTVADLLPRVFDRVEEPPSAPVFWNTDEANFAIIEAMNDLLLLVGRPTQIVQVPFTVLPNKVWQTMPKGMLAITDIQGMGSAVYKVTLEDFDYLQAYAGSDWENDIGAVILQWAPIGLNLLVVHPATSDFQTVLLTGISYPCSQTWPYNPATITIPFAHEFLQAIEKYAAAYLRFKEGGQELSEGVKLYQSYLADAQRMTEIQDRMDPWIFNAGTGLQTVSNQTSKR